MFRTMLFIPKMNLLLRTRALVFRRNYVRYFHKESIYSEKEFSQLDI